MNVEAPKPAPKGALRRLGQRLEQILIPPLLSDEELEIIERSRQRKLEDQDLGFNPLDVITIFINEMINFSYDKADKARILTEKTNSQTTPEPPPLLPGEPHPLRELTGKFNEIMKDLHH